MRNPISLLLASLCCLASVAPLAAQNMAFTYQGRLVENGSPYSGPAEMRFGLFSVLAGGTAVATTTPATASINVSNGLFTATLDFGTGMFSGEERWLEIQVRTGLGEFNTLSPRQPLTPTPYAVTALNALSVIGVDRHSLDALDGSPTDAVLVDQDGNVGVGTATPVSRLHVVSPNDADFPPRLESSGTTRFNAGWDFYHGGIGKGYVGVPDVSAPIAPGEMLLLGGPGTPVSLWGGGGRGLTVDTSANVGIGTATPRARLEVRGDVRLGRNGEWQATSGEETLRIVRGGFSADGTIIAGSGFTVISSETGHYTISFLTPFSATPTVTASTGVAEFIASVLARVGEVSAGAVELISFAPDSGPNSNRPTFFIAIGPR